MESRAKVAGHAIHPMLVVFPLGLLVTSVLFDIIRLAGGSPGLGVASWYMIAAGVLGGLAAAVLGFVDWLAIPTGTRARQVGLVHGVGNVVVVGFFILSWLTRIGDPAHAGAGPFILALIGVSLLLVTGWLGGELVERLGVSVDDGAHLDSPSSLSHLPATDRAPPARPPQPRHA